MTKNKELEAKIAQLMIDNGKLQNGSSGNHTSDEQLKSIVQQHRLQLEAKDDELKNESKNVYFLQRELEKKNEKIGSYKAYIRESQ